LAAFYEAISTNINGVVYDLGTGSGILSAWASPYAEHVFAVEINKSTAKKAKTNLESFKNVEVIYGDASKLSFSKNADVIICEMLDTALIDEEQVPVLNSVKKYLNPNGIIIPYGIINCVEPIQCEIEHICYEENNNPKNLVLGNPIFYNKIIFTNHKHINEIYHQSLNMVIKTSGIITAVKITTFTLITENSICGPTPMLNPPLIIPVEKLNVKFGDKLCLDLHYIMGGGLENVRANIKKIC